MDDGSMPQVHPMPPTETEVVDLLKLLCYAPEHGETTAYIEIVGGFIGGKGPGPAMFNFGCGYGVIRGALIAMQVPLIGVHPKKWQAPFGFGVKGKEKGATTLWKNKIKAEAKRRFPMVEGITLKTADALLILEYARMQRRA
jgi:hypothetical protein